MSTTSYDQTAYASASFPQTRPIKLATIARLFGMQPVDPAKCNVLELGTGDGSNLIPLAQVYPESTFVGIDLSARQVEEGQKLIDGAGLKNITLEAMNILDFDRRGRVFDYIIVHGVYSWVPEPVRERILSLCKEALSPDGVAYVSYNALPGWRMRGMTRDMMLYHTRQFTDDVTRSGQARSLIKFLSDNVPTEGDPYGQFLRSELQFLEAQNDSYLLHEFLETDNRAFYLRDFNAAANRHGLQFLGEPELSSILATNFDPKIQETLYKIAGDIIAMEQYMDFIRNRTFRMTLLVHSDRVLNRNINPLILRGMWFGTGARPVNKTVNLAAGVREHFNINQAVVNSDSALVKSLFVALNAATPHYLTFNELLAAVRKLLYKAGTSILQEKHHVDAEEVVLCDQLLILVSRGVIEVLAFPPVQVAATLPEKPCTTPLARHQALHFARHVTNLRHYSIKFDTFARHVISLLDGTRDMKAIVRAMAEKSAQGIFIIQNHGANITDVDEIEKLIAPRVAACVNQFPQLSMITP